MNLHKLITVCFLLFLAAPAHAQTSAQNEELTKLETQWNTAHLESDADTVAQLCADDFVVTVPRMQVMGKKEAIGALKSGRVKFQRYETIDTHISVHENTAIVTVRLQRNRTIVERKQDAT